MSQSIRYLALGDSYTVGESLVFEETFPSLLAKKVEKNFHATVQTTVIAKTGWRADELFENMLRQLQNQTHCFELITILIGVNNQYQGVALEKFLPQLSAIYDKALQLACKRNRSILMISIPDYFYTQFGQQSLKREKISSEIDQYNSIVKDFAAQKNVVFVDITKISRQALVKENLVAQDHLHPSKHQYERWVNEEIYEQVKSMMEKI
ncbi:MAG: GDSL-type esterase/lipase family protein [Bdellovibrionota bacterium]